MGSKLFLQHKNDRVFIIGKGIFDEVGRGEYHDALLSLRALNFSAINTGADYQYPVDPNDQINWMKWCAHKVIDADLIYIICSDKDIRKGPFELFSCQEYCRELAHSLKIPVYFKEYEDNDRI